MNGLQDKVALITGAAGAGMGKATAIRFAQEGSIVVVTDSHPRRTQETVDELSGQFGGRIFGFPLDVSNGRNVDEVVEAAISRCGRIDIVVNNAGVNTTGGIAEITPDDWRKVIDVDLTGAYLMIRAILPGMRQRKSGVIINIASIAAWQGGGGGAPYAAAKAGLTALTRSVAAEAGPDGVRCNAIAPGTIRTRYVEKYMDALGRAAQSAALRRIGEPSEVAAVTAFLASDDASYITGEVITVAGGQYMHA